MRVLRYVGVLLCTGLAPLALADPFFLPKVDYETPLYVRTVEIGDVTNDGIPDLVATNQIGSDSISVYRGVGDGTFLPRVTSLLYEFPTRIKLGNFDADTLVDIALPSGNRLVVGHGDGQGHFGNFSTTFGSGPFNPGRTAMGYINADSHLDLVIANEQDSSDGPDSVYVYLGNGDGTFQPRAFAIPSALQSQVDLGDVTGDGALDIVVTTGDCCPDVGHLAVLPGGGDGTFEPWTPVFVCGYPFDVVLGDVNGDAKLDIVTACADQICISTNDGFGSFTSLTSLPTKPYPSSLIVVDLDRDGKADIASAINDFAQGTDDSLLVYKGNGDGSFQYPVAYDVSDTPVDLASGDLNGDGQVDLVTASPINTDMFLPPVPAYLSVLINCSPCVTTAIAVALQSVQAQVGNVRLEWIVPGAGTTINTIYRRTVDTDWIELGEASVLPGGVVAFEDHSVEAGTRYAYRLLVMSAGDQGYSSEAWVTVPGAAPLALRLEPAYPNPFRGETRLGFTVPGTGRAALSIYDVRGRRVAKLVDEDMPAGWRSVSWKGTDSAGHPMASGTYFAKLTASGQSMIRKVLLAK